MSISVNNKVYIYGLAAVTITAVTFNYYSWSKQVPLIPRNVLFGNPVKAGVQISPDGTQIAYLAPVDNVLNLWVKTIGKEDDCPITHDTDRGIQSFFWDYKGNNILYDQDKDGDENWLLYSVNLETKAVRNLTPFKDVQVNILKYSKQFPDKMLIGLNKRDPKVHDIYELTISSGDLKLVAENPGNIIDWLADKDLQVRAAAQFNADGGYSLLVRETTTSTWIQVRDWSIEDISGLALLGFTPDGTSIYLCDSINSNTSRLIKFTLETKDIQVLAEDSEYDIGANILINPDTYEVEAVGIDKERTHWKVLDKNLEEDFKILSKLDHGDFSIGSRTIAQDKWIVSYQKDNGPVANWLYDRTTKKGVFLFVNRPALKEYTLAAMEPMQFTARDGLTIHGYITYPPHLKRKNLPLVLNVHGGPWSRDHWGYNPEVQWLANRGYVVLQVNFRGSTGYGKAFLNAANKEWSKKMHTDLIDATDWAIKTGAIDCKKIGIYGGSYGGYAALVGATFTPDTFCCAVDMVGISNLLTFLQTIPPYWVPFLETLHKRIGHPETEEELLKECSPLFKVDNIKIPILIAQGANDPRVKQSESEQIVEAMKKKNIAYEYLLFPDEGHGFVKPQNRIKFYAAAEKFLAKNLGGRYEPEA